MMKLEDNHPNLKSISHYQGFHKIKLRLSVYNPFMTIPEAEEPIGGGIGGAPEDAVACEPLSGDGGLLDLGAEGLPP